MKESSRGVNSFARHSELDHRIIIKCVDDESPKYHRELENRHAVMVTQIKANILLNDDNNSNSDQLGDDLESPLCTHTHTHLPLKCVCVFVGVVSVCGASHMNRAGPCAVDSCLL